MVWALLPARHSRVPADESQSRDVARHERDGARRARPPCKEPCLEACQQDVGQVSGLSCRRALLSATLLITLGACFYLATLRPGKALLSYHNSLLEIDVEMQDKAYCGRIDDNVDYAAFNLYSVRNVTNTTACCLKCQQDPSCRAWTWGKARNMPGLSDVCYLKGLSPHAKIKKVKNLNTTSGLPFRTDRAVSIFCFTPILVSQDEPSLLAFAYTQGAGIFGCDEYAVFSDKAVDVVSSLKPTLVKAPAPQCVLGDVKCIRNAFEMDVWKQVVKEGRFRFHEWTLKVAASAVFFPDRVRKVIQGVEEPRNGVYFSNCIGGLRTPLTLLSRIAVQVYALGYQRCNEGNSTTTPGVRPIDQCLSTVLLVKRKEGPLLLSDPSCKSHDAHCVKDYAAFRPVKNVDDYNMCLAAAKWTPRFKTGVSA